VTTAPGISADLFAVATPEAFLAMSVSHAIQQRCGSGLDHHSLLESA
jgi:hypothetical protein